MDRCSPRAPGFQPKHKPKPKHAESATDCKKFLKSLHTSNPDKLAFAHLNINSIRNKFEMLLDQIKGNMDILLVSETKIDDSFPMEIF